MTVIALDRSPEAALDRYRAAQAAFLATPCKGTAEAYRQRAFYFWKAFTGGSVGWERELAQLDLRIERAIQLHEMRTGRAAE